MLSIIVKGLKKAAPYTLPIFTGFAAGIGGALILNANQAKAQKKALIEFEKTATEMITNLGNAGRAVTQEIGRQGMNIQTTIGTNLVNIGSNIMSQLNCAGNEIVQSIEKAHGYVDAIPAPETSDVGTAPA